MLYQVYTLSMLHTSWRNRAFLKEKFVASKVLLHLLFIFCLFVFDLDRKINKKGKLNFFFPKKTLFGAKTVDFFGGEQMFQDFW